MCVADICAARIEKLLHWKVMKKDVMTGLPEYRNGEWFELQISAKLT